LAQKNTRRLSGKPCSAGSQARRGKTPMLSRNHSAEGYRIFGVSLQ
jgi:hypothetical protein